MSRRCLAIFTLLALCAVSTMAAEKPPLIPANDLLLGHSKYFRPAEVWDLQRTPACQERLTPLAYKAYSAVGFNLANTIVLAGPDSGLVVVDTLGSEGSVKAALQAIRLKGAIKVDADGKMPIKAIVYTHNHIDHTAGVEGVLALADRPACPAENTNDAGKDGTYIGRQDCVEIISQEQVVDSVINTGTVVGQMINPRSSYMYGNWIGANRINDGIGPEVLEGSAGFRMPSRTFTNELLFSAAGINMKLIHVPSETDDEIAAFLPDGMNQTYPGSGGAAPRSASTTAGSAGWGGPGMLLSAEVIQGPSFPNLYSLRGTSYRNPAQWFRSVDTLRELDSWSMVPAHGVPLCGAEDIRILLRNFRDAIQFTHDQALRRINQGHTIEELATEIHMPEYLINDLGRMKQPKPDVRMEDYLTAFYGSVPQAVREIYFGYLGWFQADPVALRPTPPRELSRRTVQMMNGPQKVVAAAAASLAEGKKLLAAGQTGKAHEALQWAAELTTEVIRAEDLPHNAPTVTICKDLTPKFEVSTPWAQCKSAGGTPPPNPLPTCTGSASFCRAREVKAAAFVAISQMVTNPNWRNWYISSAQELCGLFQGVPPVVGGLTSADIVTALPPSAWVNSWTSRLKAEKTAPNGPNGTCEPGDSQGGVHQSLGFLFLGDPKVAQPDQAFALHIRCAIAEFDALQAPVTADKADAFEHVDLGISLTYDAWVALVKSVNASVACREKEPFEKALQKALESGGVKVLKGSPQQVASFFHDYFDPPQETFQALTLR
jgi:alkyl sulfatase BDS1-like metallo-beta-lactamase superfamily hydrolase